MFDGQVVIITGGSSGIGKALAGHLVKRGAHVALVARAEDKLASAQQQLRPTAGTGQRIETFSCDVADPGIVQETVATIARVLGPPEVLVNSAGILRESHFENQSLETFHELMDINFYGTLNFIKATLPYFKQKGTGRIINICSLAGQVGVFGYSGYCASKHAIRGFTHSLRSELKPQGIKVHIVYPPETDTPMVDDINTHRSKENLQVVKTIPLLLSADAVAGAVVRGVEKDRFEIVPGRLSRILGFFERIFPTFSRMVVDRRIRNCYQGPD